MSTKVAVRKVSTKLQSTLDALTSKAAKIRHLYGLGWEVADIARKLGIIYQHAYNESHRKLSTK